MLLVCGAVAACDPTPTFPQPEGPLVGVVVAEQEVVMGADPIEFRIWEATVRVEPGTVPTGTRLLLRFLRGVSKDAPQETETWQLSWQPAAFQLLPETLTLSKPITLTVFGLAPVLPAVVDVLHASEEAATWTPVATATSPVPPTVPTFIASITEPHLWTLGSHPDSIPDPRGLFRLSSLVCGVDSVTPPPQTLELDDGAYIWTRGGDGVSCASVESGTFTLNRSLNAVTLTPSIGMPRRYGISVSANGFELKGQQTEAIDCAAGVLSVEGFTQAEAGDGGRPLTQPDGGDAGCVDAGVAGDAQGG